MFVWWSLGYSRHVNLSHCINTKQLLALCRERWTHLENVTTISHALWLSFVGERTFLISGFCHHLQSFANLPDEQPRTSSAAYFFPKSALLCLIRFGANRFVRLELVTIAMWRTSLPCLTCLVPITDPNYQGNKSYLRRSNCKFRTYVQLVKWKINSTCVRVTTSNEKWCLKETFSCILYQAIVYSVYVFKKIFPSKRHYQRCPWCASVQKINFSKLCYFFSTHWTSHMFTYPSKSTVMIKDMSTWQFHRIHWFIQTNNTIFSCFVFWDSNEIKFDILAIITKVYSKVSS